MTVTDGAASVRASVERTGPIPRPPLLETQEERVERVERLRREYLDGTLDVRVDPESDGIDRLLRDVFSLGRIRRRRR